MRVALGRSGRGRRDYRAVREIVCRVEDDLLTKGASLGQLGGYCTFGHKQQARGRANQSSKIRRVTKH